MGPIKYTLESFQSATLNTIMPEQTVLLILLHIDTVLHTACVSVLFCSVLLAVLDLRVGHTMDVYFPFIPVLCHSDWLFHGESCPRVLCILSAVFQLRALLYLLCPFVILIKIINYLHKRSFIVRSLYNFTGLMCVVYFICSFSITCFVVCAVCVCHTE